MTHQGREESRMSHSWFYRTVSPCQFSPPTWQLCSPFPTVVLWKDGKHTSVCCCFFSYWSKALKLKIEVRMEFCFAWCCVPPISHKTAWMREVPRPSLPTNRHYCFPGCQHDPGSLLLYSWGEPVPRDLSCSFPATPASPQVICSYQNALAT